MSSHKKFSFLLIGTALILAFAATGCGKTVPAAPSQLPESWYVAPKADDTAWPAVTEEFEDPAEKLAPAVDQLYAATDDALASADAATLAQPVEMFTMKSKSPWSFAAFMTDFSVSVKGVLGPLVMKGTPAVISVWRKQYPKPAPLEPGSISADLTVTSETSVANLAEQLEPAIRAALVTGQIGNAHALRNNLLSKAEEFLTICRALEATPSSPWWVSRFRLDVGVDASGKVTPAVTAGVEARFRFEWHRMMRKTNSPLVLEKLAQTRANKLGQSIQEFVIAMAQDLEVVGAEAESLHQLGFNVHSYRVGVGFSAEGNIGVAKSAASVTGHLYFSTNAKKPVINPKPTPTPGMLALVADASVARTLSVLSANGTGTGQTLVQVDREKFRKGMKKAIKIGRFFAKHAGGAGKGRWKVHELKTGFDLSLSGTVGLATVSGLGTVEINFYNQKF